MSYLFRSFILIFCFFLDFILSSFIVVGILLVVDDIITGLLSSGVVHQGLLLVSATVLDLVHREAVLLGVSGGVDVLDVL